MSPFSSFKKSLSFRVFFLFLCSVMAFMPIQMAFSGVGHNYRQKLKYSIGNQYIRAKMLGQQGKLQEAIQILQKLLPVLEDSKGSAHVRILLAKLYLKSNQVHKAKKTLKVATGPAQKKLQTHYHKTFLKYIYACLRVEMSKKIGKKNKKVVREMRFVVSRNKKLKKSMVFPFSKDTKLTLHFKVNQKAPFQIQGVLQTTNIKKPIQFTSNCKLNQTGRCQAKMGVGVNQLRVKIKAFVQLTAKPTSNALKTKPFKKRTRRRVRRRIRMKLNFKNASLMQLMKMLAELNGMKITFKASVKDVKKVSLSIKTKSRLDALVQSCKLLRLKCKIEGKKLHVSKASTAKKSVPTPPAVPKAPGGKTVPQPPKPPTPPANR